MRVGIVAALAAGMWAASASNIHAQQVQGGSDTTLFAGRLNAGATLRVFSQHGPVTVSAASGSNAEIRAERRRSAGVAESLVFRVIREGNTVTVCAMRSDGSRCEVDGIRSEGWNSGRSESVRISVALPAGVHIETSTGSGDVMLTGVSGNVRVRSGNGDVRVSGTPGEVDASTGNGALTVEGARAAVRARTGNGRVRVATARGPVSATSGNGEVNVQMASIPAEGDMDFRTGNGRIIVSLPADFRGTVDLHTGSGSVTTDFPIQAEGRIRPTRLRGTIGGGGRLLQLRTGNGNIELRRL